MHNSETAPGELFVQARALDPNYRGFIGSPDWTTALAAKDWRRFVAPQIRSLWSRLSDETRMAVFINAEQTRLALAAKRKR